MSEPSTDFPHIPWLSREHDDNRRKFPPEDLLPFVGRYIAWNWDGDRIVGSAATREELIQQLIERGIDPQRICFEYVEDL
jgi:hypothetical protein